MATSTSATPAMDTTKGTGKPIADFPPEIRMIIFEYTIKSSMELPCPGAFAPNLLLAIKESRNRKLYDEVLSIYDHLCPRVDCHNEKDFNKVPLKDLLLLKSARFAAPLHFRAQKISCQSNLESIILDFSNTFDENGKLRRIPGSDGQEGIEGISSENIAQHLLAGSRKVRRVELKANEDLIKHMQRRGSFWEKFQDGLGWAFTKTLEGGITTWVWEVKEGSAFKWNSCTSRR